MYNKSGINSDSKNIKIPLKIKNYKIEKELFIFSDSFIYLAINLSINEKVLIKIYDKEIIQHDYDEISLINNDINIMRLINHKYCLKLYEILESPSYIFLVMEYFSGVKLIDYINRKKKLTEDESLNIYKQIISLIIYFQDMKIAHLNITPENILIDTNNNIKLCDFKYSLCYSSNEKIICSNTGNHNYLCPELLYNNTCFPEYADIWSSGVLLYFLIVGNLPFKGINNYDIQKKIMGAEFALPLNVSKNMQDFFKNNFEPKIDERYNLEKIMNSSLFKEKKITLTNLQKGFNILSIKYPIDERVIEICKTHFDINAENLKQKLSKNIFDSQTSLYKQIISVFIRKKITTEIDLTSKKFNSYITNEINLLDENTKNNNIKENTKKFEEQRKHHLEQKNIIIKNQNNILNNLNALLKKYNVPKEIQNKAETEKEKIEKIENKNININKEKNTNNNIDKFVRRKNKNNTIINNKRSSKYYLSLSSKPRKSYIFNNEINMNLNLTKNRRLSSSINSNYKFNSLTKNSLKNLDKFIHKKNNVEKYIYNNDNIIKESNEEEKKQSKGNSHKSSRSSSLNKGTSKKLETNKVNNNNLQKNREHKNIKVNSVPSKNEKEQKEKKTQNNTKAQQLSKEDFFNQIRGVKLKKFTPNIYANPDEIKKKPIEEKKNQASIEYNSVSVKGVRLMIEENLKNSKKNMNNFNSQTRKDIKPKNIHNSASKPINTKEKTITQPEKVNIIKKKDNLRNSNISSNKFRKSLNFSNNFMFNSKGIIINSEDIKKEKSKDDTNKLKLRDKKKDIIIEEELNAIALRREKEEKKKREEEKKLKELEEKIKREKEEEERKMKEEKDKKIKEEEERKKKELEELRLNQLEVERIKLELEEQERQRKAKEKEEEEERQRILEEEMRKKHLEEIERQKREKEEEERKKQEEERIKKELEKEKLRLEEEEKIKKWKEEKKKQKEEEEKIKKEIEEKERKEEEEKIKKRKEEIEKKKKEEQEQNRILLEEYERKRKEEEEKKIMKELMKKKKEEELRQKREMELNRIRELNNKKNKKEESESEDEDSFPQIHSKKYQKNKVKFSVEQKKRKSGPKFFDFNKFSKPQTPKSEKESSEEQLKQNEENQNKTVNTVKENKNNKNSVYDKFNNFFFSDNKTKNKNKSEDIKITKNKEKNEIEDKRNLFYHYQHNGDNNNKKKSYNRSYEALNNKIKDKVIYQPLQNFFNDYIRTSEDNLNNKRINPKTFKKLKINIKTETKRNKYSYNNNIHSIKIKTENSRNNKCSSEKGLLTEISNNNKIKANNTFKKKNKGKLFNNSKKNIKTKVSPYLLENGFNQDLFQYSAINGNENSIISKISLNKGNLKKKKMKSIDSNNISAILNSDYQSDSEKIIYNMTDKVKSKISKKIKISCNESKYDINYSNKTNKTIIKIKKNSQKKRKLNNINESDLSLYRGEIDYNNVSIKNIKETIDNLIMKYKKEGYTYIKKEKTKYQFNKGSESYIIEIMKLGNGLLYYKINK